MIPNIMDFIKGSRLFVLTHHVGFGRKLHISFCEEMKTLEFTSIKGFKDILPDEIAYWQQLEITARNIFRAFGFQEIKTPILEKTELFNRGIGEETDIVSKEMYSLKDSKGKSLTLRPEATASVVRAYIQNRLYLKSPVQKLFTIGPMFRHKLHQAKCTARRFCKRVKI